MSEWISVNTNGRYAVNRAGEVKNLETNKKLKPSFNKAGYLVVSLYDGQTHKRRTVRVHRLVAEAFITNPDGKEDVNHIDGNKANNTVETLSGLQEVRICFTDAACLAKNQPTFLHLISPCSAWTQERYLKAGAKRQGKQILNQYTYMNVAKESGKQRVGLDGWKCPYPLRQRRKSGE